MNNLNIKSIRYSEENQNIEAIRGIWGQQGDTRGTFTIVKNLLIVNLMSNAKYTDLKLPSVYDGFIQCSDGSRIQVKDSILTCDLSNDVTGFGILVLKKWN